MKSIALLVVLGLSITVGNGFQEPAAQVPSAAASRPAQSSEEAQPSRSDSRSSELNSAIFDSIRAEAAQTDATVIVVSHLGDGESNFRLHNRRLHNARERFTYSGAAFPRERVLVAAGERVFGRGTVEVFVHGELRWVVEFRRGEDFLVDCCDEFPEYFPWRRQDPLVRL